MAIARLNVVRGVRRLTAHALVTRSPRIQVGALVIADTVPDDTSGDRLEIVTQAVAALETGHAASYRTLMRYLSLILIVPGGGGSFSSDVNACVLDKQQIAELGRAELAAIIAHEATHARIHRFGIRYTVSRRRRIEEVCTRVQADVLRAFGELATAETVVARLGTSWWEKEHIAAQKARQLGALKLPPWLVRFLAR